MALKAGWRCAKGSRPVRRGRKTVCVYKNGHFAPIVKKGARKRRRK